MAATALGSGRRQSIRMWCGRSSRHSPKPRASHRASSGSSHTPLVPAKAGCSLPLSLPRWRGRVGWGLWMPAFAGMSGAGGNVQVGFIGLGAMGALIVPRLMAAGHSVTGWNRSRAKAEPLIAQGMAWADSPRAVAEKSEMVFSIVTNGAAMRAVALGEDSVLAGLRDG